MLPRLADGKHDCAWLLNLAIGQQITDCQQTSLSVTAIVVLGWLDSVGDDLEEEVRAFIAVFERNGFLSVPRLPCERHQAGAGAARRKARSQCERTAATHPRRAGRRTLSDALAQ